MDKLGVSQALAVAFSAERRLPDRAFWAGKRVLVTGHTGFKGGWLALWLHRLGAVVCGYALAPPTVPSFFDVCRIGEVVTQHQSDIRDAALLTAVMQDFRPEIVLHLAAQSLVRTGYATPLETFEVNVMGTLNVLAAAGRTASVVAAVIVTSDKVYAESSASEGHAENARLGGLDPYSASKACAELAVAGLPMPARCRVATVRSGNVIGGGDWAADRLVADFLRAMGLKKRLQLRQPQAIRPWQHVLDPLCGYLLVAEALCAGPGPLDAWNFGPATDSEVTVETLVGKLCGLWGGDAGYDIAVLEDAPHEAPVLRLDSAKAMRELGWRPAWSLDAALERTVDWFRARQDGADMRALSLAQIEAFA